MTIAKKVAVSDGKRITRVLKPRRALAKREVSPPHIVVVDTNILWHEDKAFPVSPDFDKFWMENSKYIALELVVPEVVLGELKFQQTTSAQKTLKTVTADMSKISKVADFNHSHKIDEGALQKQVNAKIDKWLISLNGTMMPTPVKDIDWSRLVNSAVWRLPPFSIDAKNEKQEKGFRDALILETFLHICSQSKSSSKNTVFICGDYLLRETAKEAVKSDAKILIFESLQEFGSYIHLKQKDLTDQFVKKIQIRARARFLNSAVQSDVSAMLLKEHATQFSDIVLLESGATTFLGNIGSVSWRVYSKTWFIGSTQFRELKGQHEFHWVSRVTQARLLTNHLPQPQGIFASLPLSVAEQKKIQIVRFDVLWKANVKADARFNNIVVSKINYVETEVVPAFEENIKRWQLEQPIHL